MVRVDQEKLQQTIAKLKEKAKAALARAGNASADPEVRKARKKVKRAQRRLRAAKAYKSAGKKQAAGEGAASS